MFNKNIITTTAFVALFGIQVCVDAEEVALGATDSESVSELTLAYAEDVIQEDEAPAEEPAEEPAPEDQPEEEPEEQPEEEPEEQPEEEPEEQPETEK